MPNMVIYLNPSLICGNKVQEWIPKQHVFEKIWIACSNMITILRSIVNIIRRGLYDHLMSTKMLTSIMNKIFT